MNVDCRCFARDLGPDDVERYVVEPDGTLWCEYIKCPIHLYSAVSVVWHPAIGDMREAAERAALAAA